jgi:hypothetical protein
MNSNKDRQTEIERYNALDLEVLYSLLDFLDSSRETIAHAPGGEAERGRNFFESLLPQLRTNVCVRWRFCERQHDPHMMDTVNLVAAVADVVSSLTLGFPPILIATILVKKGLAGFCKCAERR